jgi:hypothetical protein
MSMIAAPLGLFACLSMAASAGGHMAPADPAGHHRHHGEDQPRKSPDPSGPCHATLCCGSNRKLKGST